MNRIASTILLVGRGQAARHLSAYFSQLNLSFDRWDRSESRDLCEAVEPCSRVILAISDDSLAGFVAEEAAALRGKRIIHLSGSSTVSGATAVHPLATFAGELETKEMYERIPLVLDSEGPSLRELLPELKNPELRLSASDRALYHALLVLAGPGTATLWNLVLRALAELGVREDALIPYAKQIAANLVAGLSMASGSSPISGPWKRNDEGSIDLHLAALRGSALEGVYRALLSSYEEVR